MKYIIKIWLFTIIISPLLIALVLGAIISNSSFNSILNSYEIIFILDPSPDNTEDIIQKEISINDNIRLIKMSRRFGQPAATMAGLFESKGDCCVVIDVDLQDPPELIEQLYKKFSEGFDVVYARRQSRKGETFIKRTISTIGYYIIITAT